MVYCSNIDSFVKCPVQFNREVFRTGNWYESILICLERGTFQVVER